MQKGADRKPWGMLTFGALPPHPAAQGQNPLQGHDDGPAQRPTLLTGINGSSLVSDEWDCGCRQKGLLSPMCSKDTAWIVGLCDRP